MPQRQHTTRVNCRLQSSLDRPMPFMMASEPFLFTPTQIVGGARIADGTLYGRALLKTVASEQCSEDSPWC